MLETPYNSADRHGPDGPGEPAREFLCVARRASDWWEALCLDLDLAVQGRSFDEVQALLQEAVNTYIEDASAEAEPARSRLLARHVPLHVRLMWGWRFFKTALYGRTSVRDSAVWLPIACHN